MNNKQSFTRGIAALMVFGLALATPSAAREQYLADRSAGVPDRAAFATQAVAGPGRPPPTARFGYSVRRAKERI